MCVQPVVQSLLTPYMPLSYLFPFYMLCFRTLSIQQLVLEPAGPSLQCWVISGWWITLLTPAPTHLQNSHNRTMGILYRRHCIVAYKPISIQSLSIELWFIYRQTRSLIVWGENMLNKLGQYHVCWCPGSLHLHHQVISRHGIESMNWAHIFQLWIQSES